MEPAGCRAWAAGRRAQLGARCPPLLCRHGLCCLCAQVRALRGTSKAATANGVGPGQHALVTGLRGLPQAGDTLTVGVDAAAQPGAEAWLSVPLAYKEPLLLALPCALLPAPCL